MCVPRAPTVSNPLPIALFTIQLLSIWSRFLIIINANRMHTKLER